MVTLYNVVSTDGFIARPDGTEDFIPDELWSTTLDLFKKYDALVMGRKTYEAMQKYSPQLLQPFERLSLKKVVVTRNRRFVPKANYIVLHSALEIPAMGTNVLVSSGPVLNTFLLERGLVEKVVLHTVPTTIEQGIRPFGTLLKRSQTPISEVELDGGIIESIYKVIK